MPLEGRQLGHYQLIQQIGSGGMGEIYLANDLHIPRQVAVKIIRAEKDPYGTNAQEVERLFQREMKAISLLDHPHILPVYDYGVQPSGDSVLTYLVMSYRPEGSLLNWLLARGNQAPLAPQEVVHLVLQAADALQHAHDRQLVHQDIKPSNFLIRMRNSAAQLPDVLLADFGIAKFLDVTSTTSQSVRGTPTYMSPEQWEGNPVPASDQYSLAIMAFQLLTGQAPFRGGPGQIMHQHFYTMPPTPSALNPRLSPSVDAVFQRALAKRPEERFPSVLQFAQALQQAMLQESVPSLLSAQNQAPQVSFQPSFPSEGPVIAPIFSSLTQKASSLASQPPQQAGIILSPLRSAVPFTPASQTNQGRQIVEAAPAVLPYNQGQVRSRRYPSIPKLLLLLTVALVIVGGSAFALVRLTGNPTTAARQSTATAPSTTMSANDDQQATAQVAQQTSATAQANQNASATAQTDKSASATALANDPYLNNKGTLLASDSLALADHWQMHTSGSWGGVCQFRQGAYHITQVVANRYYTCYATSPQAQNFIYEAQVTIARGDCGGLAFRANETPHSGYLFHLCADGTAIVKTAPHMAVLFQSAVARPALNQSNLLAVAASGDHFDLYVNKQKIGSFESNTLHNTSFALFVSDITNSTDIAFTNVKIWTLP